MYTSGLMAWKSNLDHLYMYIPNRDLRLAQRQASTSLLNWPRSLYGGSSLLLRAGSLDAIFNRSAVFSGSLHWLKPNKHRIRLGAQTEARARALFILTITVFCRLLGQIVKNEFSALLPFTWLNFVFFLRSFWSKKTEKISQVVIKIHDLRHHFKELAACLYRYNMQSRQKVHTCKCG